MAVHRSVLHQKHEFEYEVGQWLFGTVAVTRERSVDKLRTVKTVSKSVVRGSGNIVGQLKALRELQHPHISSITDVMEDQNNIYIVSEFVQGGEISDWVERLLDGYFVNEQTCAAYVRQTILALVHSHSSNIFHGALLPSSLHLSSKMPDAIIKVSDFGVASILDPDTVIVQRQRLPYTAPEILSGQASFHDGTSDMYSVGAIAHALLVGRAPSTVSDAQSLLARMTSGRADERAWAERSAVGRDFVMQLLRPWDERPTPARALQHPWLKGAQPVVNPSADKGMSEDTRSKTLCYMLAILLVPNMIPYRDFEQLRMLFMQSDSDSDGLVPRQIVQRVLRSRCALKEAVDAAIAIADVSGADILDLASTACADLISREFFASGPTSQPLVGPFRAADLAPRMVRRFFEVMGGRQTTVSLQALRMRLRTATARDVETYAGVSYDEILAGFPDKANIDGQMLATILVANGGRGTPLATGGQTYEAADSWAPLLQGGLLNLFGNTCGIGSLVRDNSLEVQ